MLREGWKLEKKRVEKQGLEERWWKLKEERETSADKQQQRLKWKNVRR